MVGLPFTKELVECETVATCHLRLVFAEEDWRRWLFKLTSFSSLSIVVLFGSSTATSHAGGHNVTLHYIEAGRSARWSDADLSKSAGEGCILAEWLLFDRFWSCGILVLQVNSWAVLSDWPPNLISTWLLVVSWGNGAQVPSAGCLQGCRWYVLDPKHIKEDRSGRGWMRGFFGKDDGRQVCNGLSGFVRFVPWSTYIVFVRTL